MPLLMGYIQYRMTCSIFLGATDYLCVIADHWDPSMKVTGVQVHWQRIASRCCDFIVRCIQSSGVSILHESTLLLHWIDFISFEEGFDPGKKAMKGNVSCIRGLSALYLQMCNMENRGHGTEPPVRSLAR